MLKNDFTFLLYNVLTVGIPIRVWIQTVLLFSSTCSFIRMRQISYRGFSRKMEKKLARAFNFTFRSIDDVLSLYNSRFGDSVDRIYPIELEIKDTTDTDRSASYLDLHLEINSEGWLRTFHSYVATSQQHLHMEYISLSKYGIPELVVSIRISLIEGCC